MTALSYIGDDERYYPSLSLTATPGMTADLAEVPTDGRWVDPAAPAPAPEPVPDPAVSPEGAA